VSRRVLVVDDDTAVRRLVQTVLTREGYEVDEAYGGRDALEKIAWDGYDAIVLDLMMPEISGFDILSAISQVRPNSKCVVVISAAAPQAISEADSPIVRARLRKPFEISDLIAAVRSCSNGDQPRRASA
jgi:DNA-binding NtrC family response regulator